MAVVAVAAVGILSGGRCAAVLTLAGAGESGRSLPRGSPSPSSVAVPRNQEPGNHSPRNHRDHPLRAHPCHSGWFPALGTTGTAGRRTRWLVARAVVLGLVLSAPVCPWPVAQDVAVGILGLTRAVVLVVGILGLVLGHPGRGRAHRAGRRIRAGGP